MRRSVTPPHPYRAEAQNGKNLTGILVDGSAIDFDLFSLSTPGMDFFSSDAQLRVTLVSDTHRWSSLSPTGDFSDPTNWEDAFGVSPSPNCDVVLDNTLLEGQLVLVDRDETVNSINISGSMTVSILDGVTLTVLDSLTVGPGGTLKGVGVVVGDIVNNGGKITAGLSSRWHVHLSSSNGHDAAAGRLAAESF